MTKRQHKTLLNITLTALLWFNFIGVLYCQTSNTQQQKTLSKESHDSTSVQRKNKPLESEIKYQATDSIVFLSNGTATLYGAGSIDYKEINLKANFIEVNLDSNIVHAKPTIDSLGNKIGKPEFSEGDKSYSSLELTYNLKNKKGFIRQAVTQEGEGYIISDKTKKTDNEALCVADGKYTTCNNHDHPDFYLNLSKAKIKPSEYIVTGPAHLVIADVPLPIAIPFGYFPFTDKYSSGFLMPSYADELTRGFGLLNGGWYFALNDYMDLELRGDLYTKGTWALRGNSSYVKRYKFNGNVGIEYRKDILGEKELANYSESKNFRMTWNHRQDQKANPNFTFSSSVNFSTSGFNRSNINYYSRPDINSQNTTNSTINFTKRFHQIPALSISGGVSLTQITRDSTISLTLPDINISYSRFYPFKSRNNSSGKDKWFEKIYMSYSGTIQNHIQTKENKLLTSSFSRDWKNGVKHSIPMGASFNLFKYINLTPTINYTERWYLQSISRTWDELNEQVNTDTISKFSRVYDFNVGASLSTKLYGFYTPIRSILGDKIEKIRHVFTPSIGIGYMPDFSDAKWGFYDSYVQKQQDPLNPTIFESTEIKYSRFEGSLYGYPGKGKSTCINYSFTNNLEMKIKNSNDTTGENPFRKVCLIENLSFNGNYNMVADSMKWSMISTNLRLKLTKNYSLSLSAMFDPYMYGLNAKKQPVRINSLYWDHGQLPKFQGTSTSYSYTFSNKTFEKLFGKEPQENPTDSKSEKQDNSSTNSNTTTKTRKDEYTTFSIPWNLSVNYSVLYGKTGIFDYSKMEYEMDFTHNLSINGNISLTENWRISANSSYDFKLKEFTYTSINVNRNLHCWNMSASIVPFGRYKSYSFRIGVNASMLSDLKYDKQSNPSDNNINWY